MTISPPVGAPLLTFLCSIRDGVIFRTDRTNDLRNGFSNYYVLYDRHINLETITAQISTRGIGTTPGYFNLYAAQLSFYTVRPKGTQGVFRDAQHILFSSSIIFSFPRSTDLKSGLYY